MPRAKKLVIDPEQFTDSQWTEMFYADGEKLLKTDRRHHAKPVRAKRVQVIDLIDSVHSKIESVTTGVLSGDDGDGVGTEAWAEDLRSAAEILGTLAGIKSPEETTLRLRVDESDIATITVALRLFQRTYEDADGDAIRAEWPDHFADVVLPLGSEDIDELIERINS